MGPDIRESLHRIARLGKDDPLQKIEVPLEQAFKRRFNQMTTVRRKMGLDMGHLDRCAHQAQWEKPGCMEKFIRDIKTEKANCLSVLWDMGGHFLVSQRSDCFDLFLYFDKRSLFLHGSPD